VALAALLGIAVGTTSCGGVTAVRTAPSMSEVAPVAPEMDEDQDDDVELVSTQGHLDPEVVSRVLTQHAAALQACYADRVGGHPWLGGDVEITWEIDADGTVTSARVSRSDLGAWEIEECVCDVAGGISFGAPKGGRTHVAAPLSFSAGSGALQWDERQAARAVGGKSKEWGKCAKRGAEPTNVTVTMYVGARGNVQSVGFSSSTGIDRSWAECAAERAMRWSLTDPRGRIAKLSFVYNPAAIADEEDE